VGRDLYLDRVSTKRATPGSQTSLREANRARIVDAVKRHGGLTQVELAGATGLSPATVSNIVKELGASGVLHTTPSTRSGRRAQHVTLARALGLVAGIHFSTRHLRVALADVAHTVVAEHHLPLAKDHRADNELNRTARLIADMLESVDATMAEVLAVGVALPAPINLRTGTISRTGIMRGWDAVPVAEVMERRLKRPVFVDNNANLGARAEFRSGALRGKENAVYLSIDDGIGAGLIVNGKVFRGHNGSAGEFGHLTIDENGPLCRCGNRGCLETYVGGEALIESLRGNHRGLKLHDIVVRAIAGDPKCIRAIGVAAANLTNIFDPSRIVVGGELSQAGELLLGPMRHALERAVIVAADSVPDIVQSQLGARAEMLGAIALAVDQVTITSRDSDSDDSAP
jgi:predicted NBD/HSP70 family sugar kinase